jgi:hypothetical protein
LKRKDWLVVNGTGMFYDELRLPEEELRRDFALQTAENYGMILSWTLRTVSIRHARFSASNAIRAFLLAHDASLLFFMVDDLDATMFRRYHTLLQLVQ